MSFVTSARARVVGGLFLLSVSTAPGAGTAVLFPEPLHLVREIEDPISGTTSTIHEYCAGDRVVTVNGARTVIADYLRDEVTEIDRNAGTFSITSFADLARAAATLPLPRAAASKSAGEPRALGSKQAADGRRLEAYEFTSRDGEEQVTIAVAVDRGVSLSAAAVEVLIGAAFPNRRGFAHDAILRAAAPAAPGRRIQTTAAAADLALPSEHSVTYQIGGERIVFRSAIVNIDHQPVPEELLRIPPGSRRVEARSIAVPRAIEELDRIPNPENP